MSIAETKTGRSPVLSRRRVLGLGVSLAAPVIPALIACNRPPATPDARATITAQETKIAQLTTPPPDKPQTIFAPTAVPIAPTARPAGPAQENKEKEPTASLEILPTRVAETKTFNFKLSDDPTRYPDISRDDNAKPGWKYVYAEFAVENKGSRPMLVMLDYSNLEHATLQTSDGFKYEKPEPPPKTYTRLGLELLNVGQRGLAKFTRTVYQSLPPGFRTRGAVVDRGVGNYSLARFGLPVPNDTIAFLNRITFLAGEQTSGYKLSVAPTLKFYEDPRLYNLVQFPEVDLSKGVVDAGSLKFPTSLPDSYFKNLGTPVSAPDKGPITIEKIVERTVVSYYRTYGQDEKIKDAATSVKIRINFRNENKGHDKRFNITMKLFGEDGMLYTNATEEAILAFPENPLYWGGFFVSSDELGPGQSRTIDADIKTSLTVKRGKLVVTGDINAIYNIELPDPQ